MSGVAIIAGDGGLPAELAGTLRQSGGEPLVCAPEGVRPDGLAVDLVFRIERLAPFLRHLTDTGIRTVAFAGPVHRMALDPAMFDPETATFVPRLLGAMQGGDDGTLRVVIDLFEEYGLEVQGLATLAPQLLAARGVLTSRAPTPAEDTDAARGIEILRALAPVDVGQGCVVAGRLCLAIEALYGTDVMLSQVAACRDSRVPQEGGVFIKRAKTGQDLRIDLPTIGPETIALARSARLSGLCLQAGHVVVLERAETLARADEAGIALWAVA
ncbi:MAG TPA: LpxI family protein [Paracoccus sp.]|nr:LpxI family protein [Paracoccus sp. (in: a-proteobacteria)]